MNRTFESCVSVASAGSWVAELEDGFKLQPPSKAWKYITYDGMQVKLKVKHNMVVRWLHGFPSLPFSVASWIEHSYHTIATYLAQLETWETWAVSTCWAAISESQFQLFWHSLFADIEVSSQWVTVIVLIAKLIHWSRSGCVSLQCNFCLSELSCLAVDVSEVFL